MENMDNRKRSPDPTDSTCGKSQDNTCFPDVKIVRVHRVTHNFSICGRCTGPTIKQEGKLLLISLYYALLFHVTHPNIFHNYTGNI